MSIRRGIVLIAFVAAVLTIGAGSAVLWAFSTAEAQLQRAVFSYQQLANATQLDSAASRSVLEHLASKHYSQRISDQKIQRPTVSTVINATSGHITAEIAALNDPEERAIEAQELKRLAVLRQQFDTLDAMISRAQPPTSASGQESLQLLGVISAYRELEGVLQSFIDDENLEVSAAARELRGLRQKLSDYTVAIVLMMLLAIGGFAWLIYQTFMNPMRLLMAGVDRYASGDLKRPIGIRSPAEFAELGSHFDTMASTLLDQQTRLHNHNQVLEQAVHNRTQALEEKAAALAQIDHSRRLFFAKVSHELRTPLTVILAEAEIATQASDSVNSTLARIQAHGQMLSRRIKDLLALARSDHGEVPIDMAPLELGTVLKQVNAAASVYAHALGLTVTVDMQLRNDIEMIGDEDWLSHALIALIDNAIKHAPPHSNITVVWRNTRQHWQFIVEDEGPGVDALAIPMLTEPYFQSDDNAARLGTGLGLAVVNWVVQKHQGELAINNRQPRGLRVVVTLPHLG